MLPPSARSSRHCAHFWMSGGVGCGQQPKRSFSATAGLPRWLPPPGCSAPPFVWACVSSKPVRCRVPRRLLPWGEERRIRAPGGGRKPLTSHDPALLRDLEALVEPVTRGDPMSPLRWTCKSTRQLAAELVRQGHQVSHKTVTESCSTRSTTACRPPARPRRKPTTPTATPSSPTSTTKLRRTSSGTNR